MSARGLHPDMRALAIGDMLIDRVTAKVAQAFAAEGIDTLVLKGPVLARWLYPGEVRPYGDSDLMVAPRDWERAVATLRRLGFSEHPRPLAHPRMESLASTTFLRGGANVDLHCALEGLGGELEPAWKSLSAGRERQTIGGAELSVPRPAVLALHVGLHAAQHGGGKAIEDLRRALSVAEEDLWREALELARVHDGVPAFASGLRLLPAGVQLTRRLGIEEVRSTLHEIRHAGTPTAEGIYELLAPGLGMRRRLAVIGRELVPPPEFMRWWSPLARRGALGTILSYPWRWIWLLAHAPRGLLAAWRGARMR
jgi:Uncharacterised nucleotidyltransferase